MASAEEEDHTTCGGEASSAFVRLLVVGEKLANRGLRDGDEFKVVPGVPKQGDVVLAVGAPHEPVLIGVLVYASDGGVRLLSDWDGPLQVICSCDLARIVGKVAPAHPRRRYRLGVESDAVA